MIKIKTFGGYSKIGKNMTAVYVDDEIILTDCGADIEKLVDYEDENANISVADTNALIENGVIPDDRAFFKEEGHKVKAIVLTHGHLDHVWAVPFLALKYKCPIIGTQYTLKVIEQLMRNLKERSAHLVKLNTRSMYKISDKISLELVNMTHSIPNSTTAVIHTKYGSLLYANDWKFDDNPTLGKKPDYERLTELGKKGVLSVISDSTNADEDGYTFSESVVRVMLEDVMRKNLVNKTIFVSTFSSHIARIRNIVEMSKRSNREVVIFGRSMHMYLTSAMDIGLVHRSEIPQIVFRSNQVNTVLKRIKDRPGRFVVICTGHQGEKGSFLDKLTAGRYDYRLSSEDGVIFSSRTIPTPLNIANKNMLQKALMELGVNIADNVHASGHASRNDQKLFLKMLKAKHFIPSHGGMEKISAAIELGKEIGYELNKSSHIVLDNQELNLEQ